MLKLYLLGSPHIEQNGRSTLPDTRKATALLATLALAEAPQTRDSLATLLWPEFDDKRAKAALRRTLSALKKVVGDAPLLISRETLGLAHEQVWCDAVVFQQQAQQKDAAAWQTAVSLYQDDFLAGFTLRDSIPFDDWQMQQAEHLRRTYTKLLNQLVQQQQQQGHFETALAHAQSWLQSDPLREEAHQQLMQLYNWTGQRSAALQQYRDCVRLLEAELGVPPLAATTELYEAIQADRLEKPAVAPPPAAPVEAVGSTQPASIPLVGRASELATLQRWYREMGENGRFVAVTGEIGIGKTRLSEQFLHMVGDAPILRGRCYQGEARLAYAPFIEALREAIRQPEAQAKLQTLAPAWLTELVRLLPELATNFPNLPALPPLDWSGTPSRLLEGIAQTLNVLFGEQAAGVLWLDDVQWADSASLDLLAFLARRWRKRPFFILVCWREGDLPADHRLHHLLAELRRVGVGAEVRLARLAQAEVDELVMKTAVSLPASWTKRLYHESEGVPFLVTAYLEAQLIAETSDDHWTLPTTARDLFLSRLAQASETGRQLLQTAAVIGRAFDFDLLQVASGRGEEESLLALEELITKYLLVERSDQTPYDYNHHKLRELVYAEMSLVRRRLLHRRVAQQLAIQPQARTALSSQIASHFERAGQEMEAGRFYQLAGDHAWSLFAHQEALSHYQSALGLLQGETAVLAQLHAACGDAHVRLGAYSAALNSYERAAALTPAEKLGAIEHKIGQVYYRRGDWELAERHFEQAERQLPTSEVSKLARLYIDWSGTAYRAGEVAKAQRYAEQAQAYANEPLSQAYTANILGILARQQAEMGAARGYFEQSLRLATEHEFLAVQITALNNLALVETAVNHPHAAQQHLESALEKCVLYGDRHWEAALRNNLADTLHQLGNEEAAMSQLKTAVAIYADIGQEAGQWQPEIWKLMEW